MRLNLNKLQYDEDACIFIEKRTNAHEGGIRTERKYLQSWDEWERKVWRNKNNKRQEKIKRNRRLERRYTKELRNLRIIEGWQQQEELNNWWEERNIDLPLQSFNEWLESHIA